MHAIAHEGCTDTVRESALKVDSGRKIPRRTEESNLPQRRAGWTLYQLSYIPAITVYLFSSRAFLGTIINDHEELKRKPSHHPLFRREILSVVSNKHDYFQGL